MDKNEIIASLPPLYSRLKEISATTPKDFEEYNALRLEFDTVQLSLQSARSMLEVIRLQEELAL